MEEIALSRLIAQSNKGALALVIPTEIVKRLNLERGQKVRVSLDGKIDEKKIILLEPLKNDEQD